MLWRRRGTVSYEPGTGGPVGSTIALQRQPAEEGPACQAAMFTIPKNKLLESADS